MQLSHHATLVYSSPVPDFKLGDFTEVSDTFYEKFGIEESRNLVLTAHTRPNAAATKTIVVRTNFITHEAQNALLKILEEPPVSTQFIFIVPEGFLLLPTLLSRFSQMGGGSDQVVASPSPLFTEFLARSYKDRLTAINEALKKKNVTWQQGIKSGLLQYIKHNQSTALSELEFVARLLLTRGASNKFLLEHLALILPTR